ncbi:MAG: nicotinate-nucleotide diphosphorylase (carboxylating), partial [Rhodococcus fascians]
MNALIEQGLDPDEIRSIVRTALAEDLRYGPDVTTT